MWTLILDIDPGGAIPSDVKLAFEMRRIHLPLAELLPARLMKDAQSNIKRFRTIKASIKESA